MTEIQIPYLPTAQFFKIRCRLGINEQDIIGDSDSDPQIRTIGGTVTISASIPRFRYTEADGRTRVVYTKTETYNIQTSTGELFDADGNIGVNLLNTNSPQMDPQGWTYKATVRPNGGDPFDVFIPSDGGGEIFDLGDGLVFTPSTGITSLETRVKALEDASPSNGGSGTSSWDDITNKPSEFPPSMHDHTVEDITNFAEATQDIVGAMVTGAGGTYDDADGSITLPSGGGGGGGYPVQNMTLTANVTISTSGWPTTEVVTLVLRQDTAGGRVATLPANIILAMGVTWLPGTYPGAETVTTFRYSPGQAKWVCEGCWVSIWTSTDTAGPTVGSMSASSVSASGFTLTVTGASDSGSGLHATPYGFSIDGGANWSAYQASASYPVSGLSATTDYSCVWRVRDAVGNVSTGTAQTVTTTASGDTTAPTWSATFTLAPPETTSIIATASAQATGDVDHYEVSYDGGSTWATIAIGGGWTFTLTGASGMTYSATRLRAVDASGNASAALSVQTYTLATELTILAADNFDREDGPLVGSTTSTGGKTYALLGTGNDLLRTISGMVGKTSTSSSKAAWFDVGTSDVEVEFEIITSSAYAGMFARIADDSNYYSISIDNNGRTQVVRIIGGAQSTVIAGGTSQNVAEGDVVRARLKEEGGSTTVSLWLNGVLRSTVTDSTAGRPAGTGVGVTTGGVSGRLDNIVVRQA